MPARSADRPSIAIVDYKAGNLTSVGHALASLGYEGEITGDPERIARAERLIFPGVGAAGAAMENVKALGLVPVLEEAVAAGKPFLGICVGMQILFEFSEEDGGTPCLGFLPGTIGRFRSGRPSAGPASAPIAPSPEALSGPVDKVPHMGWNQVRFTYPHPVTEGIAEGAEFYFVHSYFARPARAADILGRTAYAGEDFPALVARDNIVACQFHAEKSGPYGLRLLRNFCRWDGRPPVPGTLAAPLSDRAG